jgi:hypothetical protein
MPLSASSRINVSRSSGTSILKVFMVYLLLFICGAYINKTP